MYALITGACSLGLRRVAVVDLGGLRHPGPRGRSGHRRAGSPWLLIVVSFAALFMVAGKRYHDLVQLGPQGRRARVTLGVYTPSYLRFVCALAAAVTII
ncbi:MAG TPA: hypothetical protein VKG45_05390 [Actinomycetes bacterium]|nr:hypothetical protein [Actinomycetes bacterium]